MMHRNSRIDFGLMGFVFALLAGSSLAADVLKKEALSSLVAICENTKPEENLWHEGQQLLTVLKKLQSGHEFSVKDLDALNCCENPEGCFLVEFDLALKGGKTISEVRPVKSVRDITLLFSMAEDLTKHLATDFRRFMLEKVSTLSTDNYFCGSPGDSNYWGQGPYAHSSAMRELFDTLDDSAKEDVEQALLAEYIAKYVLGDSFPDIVMCQQSGFHRQLSEYGFTQPKEFKEGYISLFRNLIERHVEEMADAGFFDAYKERLLTDLLLLDKALDPKNTARRDLMMAITQDLLAALPPQIEIGHVGYGKPDSVDEVALFEKVDAAVAQQSQAVNVKDLTVETHFLLEFSEWIHMIRGLHGIPSIRSVLERGQDRFLKKQALLESSPGSAGESEKRFQP